MTAAKITRRWIERRGVVVGHVARRTVASFSQFVFEPMNVVVVSARIVADQPRRIDNRIALVAAAAAAADANDLFQEFGIARSAAKDAAKPSKKDRDNGRRLSLGGQVGLTKRQISAFLLFGQSKKIN